MDPIKFLLALFFVPSVSAQVPDSLASIFRYEKLSEMTVTTDSKNWKNRMKRPDAHYIFHIKRYLA